MVMPGLTFGKTVAHFCQTFVFVVISPVVGSMLRALVCKVIVGFFFFFNSNMQQHLQTHHLPEIIACSSHPHVSDLLAVFSFSLWTVSHGHCLEALSPAYVATASTDTPLSGNCCEFQPSPQLAGSQCFLSLWTVTHGQCLESLSPAYVAATSTDTPLSGDCCVFH